eukprot:XP_014789882.1 PREDICTED: uncharacterized protein LOC106883405 [Octopus bimaculoides]
MFTLGSQLIHLRIIIVTMLPVLSQSIREHLTSLADFVWQLKEDRMKYSINWSIVRMSSSRNVGSTAHQTEHIVSSTYRRSLYAHSRYHSTGPVEHGLSKEVSRNLLPEEN